METTAARLKSIVRHLNAPLLENAKHLIGRVDKGGVLSDWEVDHLIDLERTAAKGMVGKYAIYVQHQGAGGRPLEAVLLRSGVYANEENCRMRGQGTAWSTPRLFETQDDADRYAKTNRLCGGRHTVHRYRGPAIPEVVEEGPIPWFLRRQAE